MRTFFLLFFFFHFVWCGAQETAADVINAEKNFAAWSVQHSTKDAFLQFADSNALLFEGANAVNAIATWKKREARPGVLNWHPVYGWMAASGDMGFTTGPWTFQPQTINDSIVARGQYNTIWHKTDNGEWKFLLDMGVTSTPAFDSTTFRFRPGPIPFVPGTQQDLLSAEQAFIKHTSEAVGRSRAYLAALSGAPYLLSRSGRLPATTPQALQEWINSQPGPFRYHISDSGISRSGDMGYVYGTAVIGEKSDSYLRVWRREGNRWKLALEVLPH